MGSLKTLELYGQAVVSNNDEERRQYLTLAVAEDKNFSYAVKDLEELEVRLRVYQATSFQVNEREIIVLREKLKVQTSKPEIEQTMLLLLSKLTLTRRYHELVHEAKAYLDGLSPGTPITVWTDGIATQLVATLMLLRRWDDVLREGERYLARAPGSSVFAAIKGMVENAIRRKRDMEAGVEKAERELQGVHTTARWDLCLLGQIYQRNEQYEPARRLYRACATVGNKPKGEVLLKLAEIAYHQGSWAELRKLVAEWKAFDATAAQRFMSSYEASIPLDG